MSSVIALQPRTGRASLDSAEVRARSVRRRVGAVWALLYLNTLTFLPGGLVHIPSIAGKGLTQGSLSLALLIVLTVNPKVKVRPNVFLWLVSLLVLDAAITCITAQHFGTVYRTVRFAEFVAVLWLLTPWWGRRDMLLLRYHLRCLVVAIASVVLGLLIAPGHAMGASGRLMGAIWTMDPTQVAQYAAIAAGLTVLLWWNRMLSGRAALAGVTVFLPVLLLTHTRTALAGLLAGLLVAGLSLFSVNARVRRFFTVCTAGLGVGLVTVAGFVSSWLRRGQNGQGIATLSGRTNFWALVVSQPRTGFQTIFGFGLSNASINGLPIDSNWLASYMMEGLFGVVVCAMILVWLFLRAFFQSRGIYRALALFLVTYCSVASYTEVGFTDASTYLLHLAIAASLILAPKVYSGMTGSY